MNKEQVIARLMAAVILGSMLWSAPAVRADGKSQAAKEVAEYVLERFGRQVVREGTEALARRIEVVAARHGSEVVRGGAEGRAKSVAVGGGSRRAWPPGGADHGGARRTRGYLGGVAAASLEVGPGAWRRGCWCPRQARWRHRRASGRAVRRLARYVLWKQQAPKGAGVWP